MVNTSFLPLSINEDKFNKAKPLYEQALERSGFNMNLKFECIRTKLIQNRKKNVVWFNLPHHAEVKTNIRKHFHKQHRYKKIFSTNTIKLSYSCASNIKNLMKLYNSSIVKSSTNSNKKNYNCSNKDNFPLHGKCLVKKV